MSNSMNRMSNVTEGQYRKSMIVGKLLSLSMVHLSLIKRGITVDDDILSVIDELRARFDAEYEEVLKKING
tara:strand:- start:455 stop:667 length:213 start_codon:yes stop_codon:yes gene_type:complete